LSDLIEEHVVPLEDVKHTPWLAVKEIAKDRNEYVAAMDRHCAGCAAEMSKKEFDILFANSCMFFRTTSIGRHYSGLPKVLYLQEPYRWLYEATPNQPWTANERDAGWWYRPRGIFEESRRSALMRLWAIQIREEIRNASAFDSILCNSLYSRESILRAYGIDPRVCYLGVDSSLGHDTNQSRREPFFLTVGAVTREKNVEFVIRSLAERRDRSWPLVWVGNVADPRVESHLRKLSEELGVTLDLRVRVDDEELADLYRRAALLLYSPRLEPFGLAPLEAARYQLPTVGVAEGGVRESIIDGESGVLVDNDHKRFAEAVDALIASPETVDRLGRQARLMVEKRWTLDQAGRRLEEQMWGAIEATKGDQEERH
jgi:glycosyltransferase involved in cell wall biosynthesis